ncbi:MAG: GHKL domain-containing protein [Nitrospirae bacterium]|nr:GHKL domain-containing protein [Nitrospirota bacterium]
MSAEQATTKIAIIGAGRGGTALVELFTRCKGITITGIADTSPDAPGLRLARNLNIPATTDPVSLIANHNVDLIVDVTGNPSMPALIEQHKPAHAEILSGTAAKLVWSLIQEERNLYEHLAHAEKLSTLGTFAAGIAHEFNNPLHMMLGFAQLIQDTQDQATVQEYTQEIVKLIKHLASMSTSVNLYARTSAQGELVPVQIPKLLDEAIRMAKFSAILDEVTVVPLYGPVPDIMAEPGELLQVFMNLTVNAVQAMNARGQLTLRTGVEHSSITVSVEDTGPGIAPQDLEQIFAPFFTTKQSGKGTGLGLYIVDTIVKKYGGRIEPRSEVGKGTAFRIHFPLPTPPRETAPSSRVAS